MSQHDIIQPEGWAKPLGYSNGIAARGTTIAVSGQVGWNPETLAFESTDFVQQVRVALENLVTVLNAAGAEPRHVIRMTWFITDREAYTKNVKQIGDVYRGAFGRVYPAMTVVVVSALIESEAKVEIEVTAVLPD